MNQNNQQEQSGTNETLILTLIVLVAALFCLSLFPNLIAPTLIYLNYTIDISWPSFLSSMLNIIFEPDYAELQEIYYKNKEADFLMVWRLNNRIAIPTIGIVTFSYFVLNMVNNRKTKKAIISTKNLSLEELIVLQAKDCPYMRPVAIEDRPDQSSLTNSRWARGMKPYEFLEHYKISPKNGECDKKKAQDILESQLANHVKTIEDIYQWPTSSKILLCIFIYRIMIMRDESDKLIDLAGESWRRNKKTNVAGFDDHLIKEVDKTLHSENFVEVLNLLLSQHGYANTLILGALNQARIKAGKISTPEFIWLKPMNRVLWYALNQLGRKEAWMEAAAVTAHFQVELHDKKANYEPQTAPAMTVIELLSRNKYEEMLRN